MIRAFIRILSLVIFGVAASVGYSQVAIDLEAEVAELEAKLADETTEESERPNIEKEIAKQYLNAKEFDKAIIHMQNSIDLQEEPVVEEYLALGRLLYQTGKQKEAVKLLNKAQKVYPETLDLAFLQSFALMDLERWNGVMKQYDIIEKLADTLAPNGFNHKVYFQFGAAAERSGDLDRAAQLFQLSLERIPEDPKEIPFQATVLNYLGYMWVDNDQNLDVGGHLIKKAAELDPDSGAIADSLGWYYFKKEKYFEAMNELIRAESMMEVADDTVMDHIAQTFYKIGKTKSAISYMEKAVKLKPENKEYQARLKEFSKVEE